MQSGLLKRTVLYQKHLSLGAKMVPFAGWEMPVSYPAGILAEHNAVRNNVGIFDVGHMGLLKLTTNNSQLTTNEALLNFIQYVATNDAAKLEVNQCQYSILCNEKGGVVDDILVYRLADFYLMIANASNTDKVLSWLKKQAEGFAEVDASLWENYSLLSIQGPRSEELAEKTLNLPLSNLKRNQILWRQNNVVSRTGYTGEDGFELIAPKNKIWELWDSFIQQGVQPCGLGARDTLRLEAGLPLYGHEYDEETSPLEAGYGWAVKFDKGDFIGRGALLKQKENGTKKKLAGLDVQGRAIPRSGDPVDGGKVTSGTFSPTLKKPIALAYLKTEAATLGSEVQIEIRGKKIPAKVVAKIFYKR